jgi:hypothetical protein
MTPGESVREFYREQGRAEELDRIVNFLSKLSIQHRISHNRDEADYLELLIGIILGSSK